MTTYLPFRQARWYTQTTGRNTRVVVLHTTEGTGTAASNQAMFAVWDRVVSAHYLVGVDGVAPCVRIKDVAYAAPGANRDGIQIEQIGKAAWSRTDWLELHSVELEHVAQLLADICVDCDIPAVFLDAAAVKRGERGITTHNQITAAYPDAGNGHWDPGPGYPIDVVMARVVELLHPEPPEPGEDKMISLIRLKGWWNTYLFDGVTANYIETSDGAQELVDKGLIPSIAPHTPFNEKVTVLEDVPTFCRITGFVPSAEAGGKPSGEV